ACRALALHGQSPAPPAGPIPHIELQPLRCRQGQERLGLRLDHWSFLTALLQEAGQVLGDRQAMRMGQLLGEGQRLLPPLEGLRRKAQAPEREGGMAEVPYPRRRVMVEYQSALRR